MSEGWIGVDLDGTLAHYDGWVRPDHIGAPIPLMVQRVKHWLKQGQLVKIFTARVANPDQAPIARSAIESWCETYLGQKLEVTCCKDLSMIALYDDRCIRVEHNTGLILFTDEGRD